ncbi:MAG TPA: ATP-binding protein [Pseudonocardia sp.]|nr:ATP-binding protein [Pseudonocardia sp.]
MIALACALTGLLALGLGLLVGLRLGRRAPSPAPPAPAATASSPDPELLRRAFSSATAGLVVLDRAAAVVLHNSRAEELGVVTDGRVDARAVAASQQVLTDGRPVAVDLSPVGHRGRPPTSVLAQVQPLGPDFTMVEAGDTSEAVRLEATRRDFVANVSHELKTPVGAMGVLAEAVLDAADDPVEVRHFGTKILNESTRLGHLVTELIALSRLTGAERLPELTVVDIDEVVTQALCRSGIAGEADDVEIIVDGPSGMQVDGDRTLLVTALSNLLANAIAYSPTQASVSVSRRRIGGWAEISVTDRGIGIAPEHQERVFERFFRVDPARSRATGGTGLGLAIVKHVLNNHGGQVVLWSSLGTGSTFTMRLPLRGAATAPAPAVRSLGPARPAVSASGPVVTPSPSPAAPAAEPAEPAVVPGADLGRVG